VTKAERLATKLRGVSGVKTAANPDEMLVALIFVDVDGKHLGNLSLSIGGAFNIASGLACAAVAATGGRAALELSQRAKKEEAWKQAVQKDGQRTERPKRPVVRAAGKQKPTSRSPRGVGQGGA
jgi:hypothetical protein